MRAIYFRRGELSDRQGKVHRGCSRLSGFHKTTTKSETEQRQIWKGESEREGTGIRISKHFSFAHSQRYRRIIQEKAEQAQLLHPR